MTASGSIYHIYRQLYERKHPPEQGGTARHGGGYPGQPLKKPGGTVCKPGRIYADGKAAYYYSGLGRDYHTIGSMASYAISRRKNVLTKFLFFYIVIGLMAPVQTTLIPLINLMSFFKLQNSVGGVPRDLEEAALIDGANLWKLFWNIVFPLLKPVTTTIVIFDVMWIWNDFMLPYLFISSSDKFTLIMEVYKGVGQFINNWTVMLCTMVIVLIPITVFYVALQKHIIAGITNGAVKG